MLWCPRAGYGLGGVHLGSQMLSGDCLCHWACTSPTTWAPEWYTLHTNTLHHANSNFLGELVTEDEGNHWKITLKRARVQKSHSRNQDDFSFTEPARVHCLVCFFLTAELIRFVHPENAVCFFRRKKEGTRAIMFSPFSPWFYRKCYYSQRLYQSVPVPQWLSLCHCVRWSSSGSRGVFPGPGNSWQCKAVIQRNVFAQETGEQRIFLFLFFTGTEMWFGKCTMTFL